jgi:hypothetical protein
MTFLRSAGFFSRRGNGEQYVQADVLSFCNKQAVVVEVGVHDEQ